MTTNLSRRRSHARHGAATINGIVDAAVAEVKEARDAEWKAAKEAAAEKEASRHRFTRDELVGALAIRNRYGWHKVARVNKTTVSVETGYSWTDRIAFADVLEVRQKPRT